MFKKLIFTSIFAASAASALAGGEGAMLDTQEPDNQVAAQQLARAAFVTSSTGNQHELSGVQAIALARMVKQLDEISKELKGSRERQKLAARYASVELPLLDKQLSSPLPDGLTQDQQVNWNSAKALGVLAQTNLMLLNLLSTK